MMPLLARRNLGAAVPLTFEAKRHGSSWTKPVDGLPIDKIEASSLLRKVRLMNDLAPGLRRC